MCALLISFLTNGNACVQGQNGCETLGQVTEEEIHETSADPEDAGDNDTTDLSDMNTDEDQAAQASRLVSASPVTWHLNFNVDCVSTNCIALTDRTVGMYVSACNDGGGEYRNIEFTPVDQTGKFISYSVYQGDYPVLSGTDTVLISNPSSSFSYGPLPPHKCVTAMFESEITSPPADYHHSASKISPEIGFHPSEFVNSLLWKRKRKENIISPGQEDLSEHRENCL